MEQKEKSDAEKKRLMKTKYHSAILGAKEAKINNIRYVINRISDLQNLTPDDAWEAEGVSSFNAIAEIYFAVNIEGGVEYSNGDRFNISGIVERKGEDFILIEPLTVQIPGIYNKFLDKSILKRA